MTKKNEPLFSLTQLEKASRRLGEAVTEASDGSELKQDGTIQRLEFCFELLWKTLKIYLASVGKQVNNPRDAFKEAFRQQLFEDEKTFLALLEDRNLSTHTYDAETAGKIFQRIKDQHLPAIQKFVTVLEAKIKSL